MDPGNPRVVYGDKDGHVYLVRRSGMTSAASVFANYPYRANGDTGTITTAPLYQAGVLVYGIDAGKVYVVDALSDAAGNPKLIQAYDFGSVTVSSIVRDRSTNGGAGAYPVGTSDGKLYHLPGSPDPTNGNR